MAMLLGLILAAQSAASPVADLSAFKPFVGACWRAEFSATINDTHCFEAMYGGAHVRDRHEVKSDGKIVYAGETIYSADGPNLVFTYVNSLGGWERSEPPTRFWASPGTCARHPTSPSSGSIPSGG
jgi:hypothetical protein